MNAKIIQYPFTSDTFIQAWEIWKQYKKESFKFNYKPIGEQAALIHLAKLSGNNEEVAIEMINTSMGNGWKGFFELKNTNNGNNQTRSGSSRQEKFANYFKSKGRESGNAS